jgi:hypothetical protein
MCEHRPRARKPIRNLRLVCGEDETYEVVDNHHGRDEDGWEADRA